VNKIAISLTVNGTEHQLLVAPNLTLTQALRDELGLTGTKHGCGVGDCGACTVLLDGEPVNSCLILALEAQGRAVTTIEGLAEGKKLHPVQEAFVEKGAIQCGFCTPGMILSATALLGRNPNPNEDEVRQGLAGNLCRCTGYQKIVEAVTAAAQKMSGR
jgi:carbon-monoxide dehydrogenase small subunit